LGLSQNKVKKGIIWVLTQRLFLRIFSLIRIPILARLLSPTDFGLVGIVTTVLFFIDILTRTGFQIALIQKKENVDDYLDVGWTINLIRGLVQTGITVILAQTVANFYNEPMLVGLIIYSSISTFISSFDSIRTILLQRNLQMRSLSLITIIVSGCSFIFTVVLAYLTRNVWALVWGTIIQTVLTTVGSYIIAPYHPHLVFDISKIKELWNYGKWEFLSGLFLTLFMQGDNLFVGKVLGVTALGYYTMAYNIGNVISTEFVDSIRGVVFPAFSSIQDDLVRLKKFYLTIYHFTASIGCVFAVGLSLLAPQFVEVILGPKWINIIAPLQVLAIWGGIQMLSTSTAPLFRAINQPDWFAKIQATKLFFLIILIYPFSKMWGITGTALAALIAASLEIPVGLILTRKALSCNYKELLLPMVAPLISIIIVSALYFSFQNLTDLTNLPHLLVFGTLIVVIYSSALLIIDKFLKAGLWQIIKNIFQTK
jgi:lipopolysaccharide exporter